MRDVEQDDGNAVEHGEPGGCLAGVVQQRRLQQGAIVVPRCAQGMEHVQSVAPVAARHLAKERRSGGRQGARDKCSLFRADARENCTEELSRAIQHALPLAAQDQAHEQAVYWPQDGPDDAGRRKNAVHE